MLPRTASTLELKKKHLREIELIKQKISRGLDHSTDRSATNDHYYSLIDNLINDKDGLEHFRLRHTLQKCLDESKKEIKDDVEKYLSDTIPVTTSIDSKTSKNSKSFIPGRNTLARASRLACCQPVSTSCIQKDESLQQIKKNSKTCESAQTKHHVTFAAPIPEYLKTEATNLPSTWNENISERTYAAYAIQLSDPCREKNSSYRDYEPSSPKSLTPPDVSRVTEFTYKSKKSQLVNQKLPSINIESKTSVKQNVELVTITENTQPPVLKDVLPESATRVSVGTQHNWPTVENNDDLDQTAQINSSLLNEIINAMMKSMKSNPISVDQEPNNEPSSVTKLNITNEGENNLNLNDTPTKILMKDVEDSRRASVNQLPVDSKFVQTVEPVSSRNQHGSLEIGTQTELHGSLNRDLVLRNNSQVCHECQTDVSFSKFLEGNTNKASIPLPPKEYQEQGTDCARIVSTIDTGTQPFIETECQTNPEMRDVGQQVHDIIQLQSKTTMTTEKEYQNASAQIAVLKQRNQGIQVKEKNHRFDFSTSSDTATDSDVVVDLLSEGEIPPWNSVLQNISKDLKSNSENTLSDGEIPPHLVQSPYSLSTSDQSTYGTLLDLSPSSFVNSSLDSTQRGQLLGFSSGRFSTSSSSDLLAPSSGEEPIHSSSSNKSVGEAQTTRPSSLENHRQFYERLSQFLSGNLQVHEQSRNSFSEHTSSRHDSPHAVTRVISRAPNLNVVVEETSISNNSR